MPLEKGNAKNTDLPLGAKKNHNIPVGFMQIMTKNAATRHKTPTPHNTVLNLAISPEGKSGQIHLDVMTVI